MSFQNVVLCLDLRKSKPRPRHPYALTQLNDNDCLEYVKRRRRVQLFIPDDGPNAFSLEWGGKLVKSGDKMVIELSRREDKGILCSL